MGSLLTSTANITLGWKGLPGTNTQAYLESIIFLEKKFFMGLMFSNFLFVIYELL